MSTPVIEDNPTRQRILEYLKKTGGMTTEQLSKVLHITPMGTRQHLIALEKKGLVKYIPLRQGIGRPRFVYQLTDSADLFFPKKYDTLCLRLLETIEKREGRKKIKQIFQWQTQDLIKEFHPKVEKLSYKDRIVNIVNTLCDGDCLSEIKEEKGKIILKQYNCPIYAVAKKYREGCQMELDLYRSLVTENVTRTECQVEGAHRCVYVFSI